MATSTTNLSLIKPAGSDKIRIAQINQNMDTLDAKIGAVGDTSLQAQNVAQDGAMAIVSTGNTHSAISAGQFVYVRNHGTLAEGLYTANSAITSNAILSSSNLTAVSGGGFNALKATTDALNDQLTYQASSNIATQSAFDTVLDNALSSASTNSEVHLRINVSASFGLFVSGEVYLVDMKKTASTTYSTAIISQTGAKNIINATRNSNGWSYDSITDKITNVVKGHGLRAGTTFTFDVNEQICSVIWCLGSSQYGVDILYPGNTEYTVVPIVRVGANYPTYTSNGLASITITNNASSSWLRFNRLCPQV